MNTREAVEWLATVCTIGLWLTGIPTCRKIFKQGNTNNVAFFPFLAMFCSSTLWFKYGIIKEDNFLIKVNSIGAALNFLFAFMYYTHCHQKALINKQIMFGIMLLYPMLMYVKYWAPSRTDAILYMGLECASLSVLAYGAPLVAMADVLKTGSTEVMSFPLCVANFIVSFEWFYYGVIMGDLFIKVPNGIGICLGVLQLTLFLRYNSCKSRTFKKSSVRSEIL